MKSASRRAAESFKEQEQVPSDQLHSEHRPGRVPVSRRREAASGHERDLGSSAKAAVAVAGAA